MYGFESLKDLLETLLVPAVGGTVVLLWPELQAWDKGKRFERLILRELEEVAPYPKEHDSTTNSWVDHQKKDFLHKRLLEDPSKNRDFILSLDATLVYHVSQLWDARKSGNGSQWIWHLSELNKYYKNHLQYIFKSWDDLVIYYEKTNPALQQAPGAAVASGDASLVRPPP